MSTRSLTVFMDGDKEIAVMYTQHDALLHEKVLRDFVKGSKIVNGLSGELGKIANGMASLAIQIIQHFPTGPGEYYLHPAGTRNIGEEYIFFVVGSEGVEPTILRE